MITISNTEVVGWEHAIRGMRNPMNSWDKSDSDWNFDCIEDPDNFYTYKTKDEYEIGPKDLDLMMVLRRSGTDHRKFMRMIAVYLDITAPLYWWKEFSTYKVGTVANSCSTMHKIHAKEFTLDDFSHEHIDLPQSTDVLRDTINTLNYYRDLYLNGGEVYTRTRQECIVKPKDKHIWWQMIQLLPTSYNQKRTVMLNYEVLANMYKSRRDHKLDEWHEFCDWMETLPMPELITGERKQPNWTPSDQGRVLNYILQNDPRRDVENVAVRITHSSPYVVDYIAVGYDDSNAKKVWYSFDMTKVTVIEALDAVKKAIAKMTENVSANGLSETSNAIGLEFGA